MCHNLFVCVFHEEFKQTNKQKIEKNHNLFSPCETVHKRLQKHQRTLIKEPVYTKQPSHNTWRGLDNNNDNKDRGNINNPVVFRLCSGSSSEAAWDRSSVLWLESKHGPPLQLKAALKPGRPFQKKKSLKWSVDIRHSSGNSSRLPFPVVNTDK